MLRRRMWRQRALQSAIELATWPPGKPERHACESEVIKSLDKVRQWFREPRAALVIQEVQRRAVAAFRERETASLAGQLEVRGDE
ncbi:hypothetical protein [Acidovorax sp. SDU_ACID1]|uniref:hypothetical protein n=1 Tax=Acidovorax sp. SDU_ACID1 TaxID=3136632 RepID=UPI003873BAC0